MSVFLSSLRCVPNTGSELPGYVTPCVSESSTRETEPIGDTGLEIHCGTDCVCVLNHVLVFCEPMDCKPFRLLCPWDFPCKNTRMGCRFLLQGILPTQGSNVHLLRLLRWQADGFFVTVPPVLSQCQILNRFTGAPTTQCFQTIYSCVYFTRTRYFS